MNCPVVNQKERLLDYLMLVCQQFGTCVLLEMKFTWQHRVASTLPCCYPRLNNFRKFIARLTCPKTSDVLELFLNWAVLDLLIATWYLQWRHYSFPPLFYFILITEFLVPSSCPILTTTCLNATEQRTNLDQFENMSYPWGACLALQLITEPQPRSIYWNDWRLVVLPLRVFC